MANKQRVPQSEEFAYYDKFRGESVAFEASEEEVMVTFDPPEDTDEVLGGGEDVFLDGQVSYESGFGVMAVPDTDADEFLGEMEDADGVLNAIPVLIDGDGNKRFVLPDELTVQFLSAVSEEQAEAAIGQLGSEVIEKHRTKGYYTITVPDGDTLFQAIGRCNEMDTVEFAEPSDVGFNDELQHVPSTADFPKLWGMRNQGQRVNGVDGTAGADVRATHAWEVGRGSPDTVIAVIDTGMDMDHPNLKPNLLDRGTEDWNFAQSGSALPEDSGSHGTHVAGIAAAPEQDRGVVGLAPQSSIMPLRVNLTAGRNQNRADAINYVAEQAAANPDRRYVMNCSWRMSGNHNAVLRAIRNAVNANVVVIFAAGNANRDIDERPQYPAAFDEVIAVAATNQDDKKASFSNFGQKVDVSAPGRNIFSTVPHGRHDFKNGTSMAAPMVAGLAALIWSRKPDLTNAQVRERIESTADPIDAENPDFAGKLGAGRINALRALHADDEAVDPEE